MIRPEPKSECDTSAILGSRPKRRTCQADIRAISAISAALGSWRTCVSVMNSGPLVVMSMLIAEKPVRPGVSPRISRIDRSRLW